MLARVRALLAKAESTTFDEEAEALTAKAQELIARHALDEAALHDAGDVGDPSVRRIPLDPPYAKAKAFLLNEVADANRCRAVHSDDCGWVTVFGYDGDLHAVELLTTSLFAQATAAMARHGSRRDATGRSRTRSSGARSCSASPAASASGSGRRPTRRCKPRTRPACCRCSPRATTGSRQPSPRRSPGSSAAPVPWGTAGASPPARPLRTSPTCR